MFSGDGRQERDGGRRGYDVYNFKKRFEKRGGNWNIFGEVEIVTVFF